MVRVMVDDEIKTSRLEERLVAWLLAEDVSWTAVLSRHLPGYLSFHTFSNFFGPYVEKLSKFTHFTAVNPRAGEPV